MEEETDLLEDGLPSEDQIIEIVDHKFEITFKDVLLKGVRLAEIAPTYDDLQNRNENISPCI